MLKFLPLAGTPEACGEGEAELHWQFWRQCRRARRRGKPSRFRSDLVNRPVKDLGDAPSDVVGTGVMRCDHPTNAERCMERKEEVPIFDLLGENSISNAR